MVCFPPKGAFAPFRENHQNLRGAAGQSWFQSIEIRKAITRRDPILNICLTHKSVDLRTFSPRHVNFSLFKARDRIYCIAHIPATCQGIKMFMLNISLRNDHLAYSLKHRNVVEFLMMPLMTRRIKCRWWWCLLAAMTMLAAHKPPIPALSRVASIRGIGNWQVIDSAIVFFYIVIIIQFSLS